MKPDVTNFSFQKSTKHALQSLQTSCFWPITSTAGCSTKSLDKIYIGFPNKNIKAPTTVNLYVEYNIKALIKSECMKIKMRGKIMLKFIVYCKTEQNRNLYHSVFTITIISTQLFLYTYFDIINSSWWN